MIKATNSTKGRGEVLPAFRIGGWYGELPQDEPRQQDKKEKKSDDDAVVLEGRFKVLRGKV